MPFEENVRKGKDLTKGPTPPSNSGKRQGKSGSRDTTRGRRDSGLQSGTSK